MGESCDICGQEATTFTRCVYEVSPWEGPAVRWAAGEYVYAYCDAHDPGGHWEFMYNGTTVWHEGAPTTVRRHA